jgi:hypothetical protein
MDLWIRVERLGGRRETAEPGTRQFGQKSPLSLLTRALDQAGGI